MEVPSSLKIYHATPSSFEKRMFKSVRVGAKKPCSLHSKYESSLIFLQYLVEAPTLKSLT